MWKTPASGGATVLKPGRNLAISSERGPRFANTPSVRRTQESGSRDILQRSCRTFMPLRRPREYQMESAATAASTTYTSEAKRLRWPVPASAPAASNNGMEGRGSPICSAKTQPSRTVYPCWRRNSTVRCMIRRLRGLLLFRKEKSSMPPLARHHKFREGLACSGSNLAILQRWGEGFGIAGVADGQSSKSIPICGNLKCLTRLLRIETGHLMNKDPSRCGFHREKG